MADFYVRDRYMTAPCTPAAPSSGARRLVHVPEWWSGLAHTSARRMAQETES
jgi:hypothetical protein